MIRKFPLCEEEDDGGGGKGGGYYCSIPTSIAELSDWWDKATKGINNYPLYAVLLASENDTDVVSFVSNCREELGILSGKDCCFIYFRDEEKVIDGIEWQFLEHAKVAVPFAQLLKANIPSIIFFEEIKSGMYISFPLKHLSSSQALLSVRDLFYDFYRRPNNSSLERIRLASKKLKIQKLTDGLLGKVDVSATEFFKAIGKTAVGLLI